VLPPPGDGADETVAPPSSTYRLQVNAGSDLGAAAEVCDYLDALGVGAVYCSPVLQSAAGSDHGYDVTDHDHIDAARGGREGWQALLEAARAHELGLVVDIVPNHMGVADASANAAWWDVLRLGPSSPFAQWFDIEWTRGRLLLPVLGDGADPATDLQVLGGELRYAEHRFPIAPGTGPFDGDTAADVHERQQYELVNFRRADTDQNYRRFFAVTTLAGLRIEDEGVAAATHREIVRWVAEDGIVGLRIDHPDGLLDPGGYLDWLREQAPGAWITVEKILEPGERLPSAWPVAGTTGYDALAEVNAVFVDPAGEAALTALYHELTGDGTDFAAHVQSGKRFVISTILQAEVLRLARLVPDIDAAGPALAEALVAMPVYRSYLPLGAEDLDEALRAARERRPELAAALQALTPRLFDPADELCRRFQQTSGAVMAKGVEDTAYYLYSRFIALNEVGADPARFGCDLDTFHTAQLLRQRLRPAGMTTLSTHDTKRGEDVRARLAVLAEVPAQWAGLVRTLMDATAVPDARFGYLLWQTFAGTGLIARERMHAYAEKAMREAGQLTNWIDPVEAFESAVHAAIDTAYDDPYLRAAIEELLAGIEAAARSNSLAQKLVQLTMPGVPDTYQGSELWEDNLVDPDNRRAVDYSPRRALLAQLDSAGGPPPVDASGAAKLWTVSRALRLRRDRPDLFTDYHPVRAVGSATKHVLAYDRGGAITVATRLPAGLQRSGGFGDTAIELDREYLDVLSGRRYRGLAKVADLLRQYPVALLMTTSAT